MMYFTDNAMFNAIKCSY
uniref:Uncharacterized protein n=1 Tax=Anguilla anguilla TaxID=7936 RepID=A0A0E9U841_ANGAN